MDLKKIGVIILFILAVLLFGFFIYWFFWRPLLAPEPTVTSTSTAGQLIDAGTGGVRTTTGIGIGGLPLGTTTITGLPAITQQPATTPESITAFVNKAAYFSSISSDGKIVFYDNQDGKFYKIDASGNSIALSNQSFPGVSNAVFDNQGGKAVLEYPDGSNIVYDFNNGKQYTLPKHWEDFNFSPTDQEIVFKNISLDPENRFLVTAKFDGSNAKIIETIGENANKVYPNWSPNNQVVATYNEGLDANRSEIFFIGQNNENFKSLLVEGRDFRGVWSPDGNQMLYSVYDPKNDYKPQLWISNASGEAAGSGRQKIELETWADRCTFAGNNYVFCSAPETLTEGAGLEPRLNATTPDKIWAINLSNGQTRLVSELDNIQYVNKVMFDETNPDRLYVSGSYTNKIYKIQINQ